MTTYADRAAAALLKHGMTPYQLRISRAAAGGRTRQGGRGHTPPKGQNEGSIRRSVVERLYGPGVTPHRLSLANKYAPPKTDTRPEKVRERAQTIDLAVHARQPAKALPLVDERRQAWRRGEIPKDRRMSASDWAAVFGPEVPPEDTNYHD